MKETKQKNAAAVELGRLGGRAGRGKAKVRSSEQMRRAARARWDAHHGRTPGPKARAPQPPADDNHKQP